MPSPKSNTSCGTRSTGLDSIPLSIQKIPDSHRGSESAPPNPSGLCMCGCSLPAPVATQSRARLGYVKGQSLRFINGHAPKKHGFTRTPTYRAWRALLRRCFNPKDKTYADYGGRGITVCDRWNPRKGGSFRNFLADVGSKPPGKDALDRYPNNDGNYEPQNVRWASWSESNKNRRSLKQQGQRRRSHAA